MKPLRALDAVPGRLSDFIVRRPFVVLALLLAVTAVAGAYAWRVRFDFTPQAIFSGEDDLISYSEQFKREFGYEDTVIIVGFEATGPDTVVAPDALTWQASVVAAAERLPHVKRVESLISMKQPRVTLSLSPQISYEPIVDAVPVTREVADRLREALSETELPFGSLVSKDLRMAGLLVVFDPSQRDFDAMQQMVRSVDEVLARYPVPRGYRLQVSGLPVLRVDIVQNLQRDQARLMPLAGALYLITLALAFRSVSGSLLPLFAVGQGLVWTFGLIAARSQSLNIVSNILPCMLLINGVSNSVHILSRYAEEADGATCGFREAVRRTLKPMIVACLGAFATAAIGFYSLHSASSQVLKEFATQAAIGLMFLYVTVILTLGALLGYMKPPALRETGPLWNALSGGLARTGCRLIRRPWRTVALFVAMAGAFLACAWPVEVNSTTLETYDEDHPTIQSLRTLETRLSGLLPLEISLQADEPEEFYRPDVFRRVAVLRRFADDQPAVLFSRTYIDFLNEINSRFVPPKELYGELPRVDAEGKHRIDRAHRFLGRVAGQMRYGDFMTRDERRARLLLKIRDVGTRDTLVLVRALEAEIARLFPTGSGITARVTGDALVNAQALTGMIYELLTGILTASLVIFAAVALLFRSLRIGLITIPPNIIPLAVTFGYMGLRGFDLNVGNVIVFTISLGIAVDNTIHYLLRFREEFALDPDMAMATWKTLSGKGQPMFLSTLLIVIGLAVLLGSDFVPTRRFAELTIVTLSAALVSSLFLLPACVALLWGRPVADSSIQAPKSTLPQRPERLPT